MHLLLFPVLFFVLFVIVYLVDVRIPATITAMFALVITIPLSVLVLPELRVQADGSVTAWSEDRRTYRGHITQQVKDRGENWHTPLVAFLHLIQRSFNCPIHRFRRFQRQHMVGPVDFSQFGARPLFRNWVCLLAQNDITLCTHQYCS